VVSGGLGPVAAVHPGENSAFSYNRDIAFHLCSVFAIGARLANSLYGVDRRLVASQSPKVVGVRDSDWSRAILKTSELPSEFFPDEVSKPVPKVQTVAGKVFIEYPAGRHRISGPPPGSEVRLHFGGDGVTRSFKLPYFGEER
jgi:hypothetical protein